MGTGNSAKPTLFRRTALQTGAAAGLAAVGLAGCTNNRGTSTDEEPTPEPAHEEPFELIHWWTAGGEEDALEALLEGFLESTEYDETDLTENPAPGGAGSALNAAVQSRLVDDDPPSTFQIWPGESLRPFLDSEVFGDLEEIWDTEMESAYIESVTALARDGGTYVAVPINIHRLNNLFYNIEVVEDSGVDPHGIDDPVDLLEAFETVADAGYIPFAHQTQEAWPTVQLWETLFIGIAGPDAFHSLLEATSSHSRQIFPSHFRCSSATVGPSVRIRVQ